MFFNFKYEKIRERCNNYSNIDNCNQKQHCIWSKNILENEENIAKKNIIKYKKNFMNFFYIQVCLFY
jgi:hypothetical protein